MSSRPDWFDDFIIMEMMEEDDLREGSSPSSNSGCFLGTIGVLLVIGLFLMLIG